MVHVLAIYQASNRLLRASGMPFSFAPIYSCHATKMPDTRATFHYNYNFAFTFPLITFVSLP